MEEGAKRWLGRRSLQEQLLFSTNELKPKQKNEGDFAGISELPKDQSQKIHFSEAHIHVIKWPSFLSLNLCYGRGHSIVLSTVNEFHRISNNAH